MKSLILATLAVIFVAAPKANALVEVRAGYGLNMVNPGTLNDSLGAMNVPKVSMLGGFNLDAIVSLPLVPIGFGLRYETQWVTAKATVVGNEFKYTTGFKRTSLLLNYRLIDTLVYLGPIATVGLINQAEHTYEYLGTKNTYTADGMTFSVGAEGGAKLGIFTIGGELGYLFGNFGTGKKDGADLTYSGKPVDLDFTGMYIKILAGVGF